ncbi:MAG: hypothetical protein H6695_13785 [Deferribacteres bacterium]|nr:hypothetical protein [Deferribacteres bacterium]
MAKTTKKKKQYTQLNLPFSSRYVKQLSRFEMIVWGCVLAGAFLTYFFFDATFQKNSFIASGELSSPHAGFEKKCESCHDIGQGVEDVLCSSCHEKTSIFTVYDFDAHYLYRSNDASRVLPTSIKQHESHEMPCSSCHLEHRGKNADLRLVSDKKCLPCHAFGSFNKKHPEFEFAHKTVPDDSTLLMTHIRHTGFVLQEIHGGATLDAIFQTLKLDGMDDQQIFEQACLFCHNPEPDGRNFSNVSFDKHCMQCHVKADASVLGLPLLNPMMPNMPGVESIRQMQLRGGAGLAWAYASNPGLTPVEGSEVSKSPVYHKDPWIMESLSQIRQKLYPASGLSDLLQSAGEVTPQRIDTLYSHAIATLQQQTNELQARPELQGEVAKINLYLQKAREQLQNPLAVRNLENFQLRSDQPYEGIPENMRAAYLKLVRDLTAPDNPECRKCHLLNSATIARVQADQDVLIRAEFNHRAHIIQERCTDCHTRISIDAAKVKLSIENFTKFKTSFAREAMLDRSATQNIPRIESCKKCHSPEKVSNSCTTCHTFHPNKLHRASFKMQ